MTEKTEKTGNLENLEQIQNKFFDIKGVWFVDTNKKGIYDRPTIYIWVYKNYKEAVIADVEKMYPNTFYVFEPITKEIEKNKLIESLNNKLILKINQIEKSKPTSIEPPSRFQNCNIS